MADKYLYNNSGTITERAAILSSAGAGNSGNIPALDATGRLDSSFMPVGLAADTAVVTASEALSAGDFVNIWNSTGAKVRRADGSTTGKEAHGYVLAAVASSASATVYFNGSNTQVTGATAGVVYLSSATPGGYAGSAPSGSGQTVQRLGVAVSATVINFNALTPIALA